VIYLLLKSLDHCTATDVETKVVRNLLPGVASLFSVINGILNKEAIGRCIKYRLLREPHERPVSCTDISCMENCRFVWKMH
jgi:hypothetical protein